MSDNRALSRSYGHMKTRLTVLIFHITMTRCLHVIEGTRQVLLQLMVTHLAMLVEAHVSDVEGGAIAVTTLLRSVYIATTQPFDVLVRTQA